LRGFNPGTGEVEDEPRAGLETVITLLLQVGADLEPTWTLFSERAEQQQLERTLPWKERAALAPARIGSFASSNLSWSRGSVLNRLPMSAPSLVLNWRAPLGKQERTLAIKQPNI
jgi:hypothetical protein